MDGNSTGLGTGLARRICNPVVAQFAKSGLLRHGGRHVVSLRIVLSRADGKTRLPAGSSASSLAIRALSKAYVDLRRVVNKSSVATVVNLLSRQRAVPRAGT